MKTSSKRTSVVLAAGALMVLSACSSGGGGDTAQSGNAKAQTWDFTMGTAADSTGPAKEVPGAKKGGTVQVLQRDTFNFLDPGQIYTNDILTLQLLYNRSLTTYKVSGDGKVTLVGDLATDTGTSSDGGRTWTYHLKDGLKFEDGSRVTSADVRHSIERLYAPYQTDGPTYLQQWLSGPGTTYRKALPDGPYKGKHLPASVLDTPDSKTIVFHFIEPHAETPYAAAMPNISAVPAKRDNKEKYNNKPVALGPYKIASFQPGKSLTLVRNKNWDPKTDPVRHQYVDKWEITFGHQVQDTTRRLLADVGGDKQAMTFSLGIAPEMAQQVLSDSTAKSRTINEVQPYVDVINFNTRRLTDVRVRKALAYAIPSGQILQENGGATGGEVAGNLLAPSLSGWQDTDPFGKKDKPAGDPDKARQLLKEAGQEGKQIVYAYANTAVQQKVAVVVVNALKKAGFKVVKKEINSATYYSQIAKVDNGFDIFRSSWSADWPSGSTVLPPVYDGRVIADGAKNYSQVNDPAVNKDIDRIKKIADTKAAAGEWVKLADKLLVDDVPQVPVFYNRLYTLYGSGLGGVSFHPVYGDTNPTGVYVK